MQTQNYWLVGAAFGGEFDIGTFDWFLETGVWYCWDPKDDKPDQTISSQAQEMRNLFMQIKRGDRIAIKKKNVHTQKADILAIGIVKADADVWEADIMKSAWRIYVNWLPVGENGGKKIVGRRVALNNLQSAIHTPYKYEGNANPQDDAWIREIFSV